MKKNVNSTPVNLISDLLTLPIMETDEQIIVDMIKELRSHESKYGDYTMYGPATGRYDISDEFDGLVDRVYNNLCLYQNSMLPAIFCVKANVDKVETLENGEETYGSWVVSVVSIDNHAGQHVLEFKKKKDNTYVSYCQSHCSGIPGVGPAYTIPEAVIRWTSNQLNGEWPLRITEAFFDDATGLLNWFDVEVGNEKIGWTIKMEYEYRVDIVAVNYIKSVVHHME